MHCSSGGAEGVVQSELNLASASANDTAAIGQGIGAALQAGDVVCLQGDLGAGKTHLTQGIARGMGIGQPVTSPTFTLVNEYSGRLSLAHFDFYRLERSSDLDDIGFDEYMDGDRVVVIEWADRFPERLPAGRISVVITVTGPSARLIRLTAAAEQIERISAQLASLGVSQ